MRGVVWSWPGTSLISNNSVETGPSVILRASPSVSGSHRSNYRKWARARCRSARLSMQRMKCSEICEQAIHCRGVGLTRAPDWVILPMNSCPCAVGRWRHPQDNFVKVACSSRQLVHSSTSTYKRPATKPGLRLALSRLHGSTSTGTVQHRYTGPDINLAVRQIGNVDGT